MSNKVQTIQVFEAFAGIGAQKVAFDFLNSNFDLIKNKFNQDNNLNLFSNGFKPFFKVVATSDWDINANIVYDSIHHANKQVSKLEILDDELDHMLSKYTFSMNGKSPYPHANLMRLSREYKIQLLSSMLNSNNQGSIVDLDVNKMLDLISVDNDRRIDLITYSFPCQDLSNAGKNLGLTKGSSTRSGLLWEVEKIIQKLKKDKLNPHSPKYLLLENVPNMLSKLHKDEYEKWCDALSDLGYITKTFVLDSSTHGSIQARKRVFAFSIFVGEKISRKVKIYDYPSSDNCKPINLYVNAQQSLDDVYNSNSDKYKNEEVDAIPNDTPSRKLIFLKNPILDNGKLFYIKNFDCYNIKHNSKECNSLVVHDEYKFDYDSISIFDVFRQTKKNRILKPRQVIRTITTKHDRLSNAGNILLPKYIGKQKNIYRFFTPRESFLLMGFSHKQFEMARDSLVPFKYNSGINNELYRQAGNSIVVNPLIDILWRMIIDDAAIEN